MNLNNVFSYKDFLNEKNQYAVFVNGEKYGKDGDYKSGRLNFEDALSSSNPGTKVELYKVEDTKGKLEKPQLKKSQVVTEKEIKKATINDIKQTIQQQLLDLYFKVSNSSVMFKKDETSKAKKLTSVKEGDIEVGRPFIIQFSVSPMDFSQGVQISNEFKDNLKFNKEYNEGVSQKKPYLLIVQDIKTDKGVSAFYEDIEAVKKKAENDEELTDAEKELIYNLKKAHNITSTGSEKDKFERKPEYTLEFTLKIIDNPDFGVSKKEDEIVSDLLDDDFFGTKSKTNKEEDLEEEPTIDDIENIVDTDIEDVQDDDLPY